MSNRKLALGIGVIILCYIATAPIVVASSKSSTNLTVTIINETSANVQWRISYTSEFSAYLPLAYQNFQDNIADVEVGIEQLFLQDAHDITIAEDNETLIITFGLAGNYSDAFVTGKYQSLFELQEYAPGGIINVLTINIPDAKYLLAVNPGPNEIKGNELVYYDYNWIYPLEVYYSDHVTATQVGEEWKLPVVKTISVEDMSAEKQAQGEASILSEPIPIFIQPYGINDYSNYTIPNYGVYVGSDPVPETGKTAYEIANDIYKPDLYLKNGMDPPNSLHYRILKGLDPYTEFDAYLIQFYGYWNCQETLPGFSHEHDFEPIFIWVQNIGDRPYRVVFDRIIVIPHYYDIYRTYKIMDASYGEHDIPSNIHTQHSSYFPYGRLKYEPPPGTKLLFNNISVFDATGNWRNNTHVKLRIATDQNTYDPFYGKDATLITVPLSPLDDSQLKTWYRIKTDDTSPEPCCSGIGCTGWGVMPFTNDVSDSFHDVFYEGAGSSPTLPTLQMTINSASASGTILTVDASATYTNSKGTFELRGLWKDRFSALLDDTPIGNPIVLEEYNAGDYSLSFDVSSIAPGTHIFKINLSDNLDEAHVLSPGITIEIPPVINLQVTQKWSGWPDPVIKDTDNIDLYARVTNSVGDPIATTEVTLTVRDSYNQELYTVTNTTNSQGEVTHSSTGVFPSGRYYAEAIVGSAYKEQRFYIVNAEKVHPAVQLQRGALPYPVTSYWAPEDKKNPMKIIFTDNADLYNPATGSSEVKYEVSDDRAYTVNLVITSEKSNLLPPSGSDKGFPSTVTTINKGFEITVEIPQRSSITSYDPSTNTYNPRRIWFYKALLGKYFILETPPYSGSPTEDKIRVEQWVDGELVKVTGMVLQIYPKTSPKKTLLLSPDTDWSFLDGQSSEPFLTLLNQKGYDVDIRSYYTSTRISHNWERIQRGWFPTDGYVTNCYSPDKEWLETWGCGVSDDELHYFGPYARLHSLDNIRDRFQIDLRDTPIGTFRDYDLIVMKYEYDFNYVASQPFANLRAEVPYTRTGAYPYKNEEFQFDAPGLKQWIEEGGNLLLLSNIDNDKELPFREWNVSLFDITPEYLENSNYVPSSVKSAWLQIKSIPYMYFKAQVATLGSGKIVLLGEKSVGEDNIINYDPYIWDVYRYTDPNSVYHAIFLDEVIRWLADDKFEITPAEVSFVPSTTDDSSTVNIVGFTEGSPRAFLTGKANEAISGKIPSGLYTFYVYADGHWPRPMSSVMVNPSSGATITLPSSSPMDVDLGVELVDTIVDYTNKYVRIRANLTNFGYEEVYDVDVIAKLTPVASSNTSEGMGQETFRASYNSVGSKEIKTPEFGFSLLDYIDENQTKAEFEVEIKTRINTNWEHYQEDNNPSNNKVITDFVWRPYKTPLIIQPMYTSLYFSRYRNGQLYAYPGETLSDFISSFAVINSATEDLVTDAYMSLDITTPNGSSWIITPTSGYSFDNIVFTSSGNYGLDFSAEKLFYQNGRLQITVQVYNPRITGYLSGEKFAKGDTVQLSAQVFDEETGDRIEDVDVGASINGVDTPFSLGTDGYFRGSYTLSSSGNYNMEFYVKRNSVVLDTYTRSLYVSNESYPYYARMSLSKSSLTRPDNVEITATVRDPSSGSYVYGRSLTVEVYTTKKDGSQVTIGTVYLPPYGSSYKGRLYVTSVHHPPGTYYLRLFDSAYPTLPLYGRGIRVYADTSLLLSFSQSNEEYYRGDKIHVHTKLYDNRLHSTIPPLEVGNAEIKLKYPNGSKTTLYEGSYYFIYTGSVDVPLDYLEPGTYYILGSVEYYVGKEYATESFRVYGKSNLDAEVLDQDVNQGYPIVLTVRASDEYNSSIKTMQIKANVDALGISATLLDDGEHLDGNANDGIYGALIEISPSIALGTYEISVNATKEYYSNSRVSLNFTVVPPSSGGIRISEALENETVMLGDTVNVTYRVDNVGDLPVNVSVEVRGNNSVQIVTDPTASFELEGRGSELLTWELMPIERGTENLSFAFVTETQTEVRNLSLITLKRPEIIPSYGGEISTHPSEQFTIPISLTNKGDVNATGTLRLRLPPEIESIDSTDQHIDFKDEAYVSWSLKTLASGTFTAKIQLIEDSGRFSEYPLTIISVLDTESPTYSNLTPQNNSYTNDSGQDISIVIMDDLSGVNAGSISMNVAGDYYDANSGKLEHDTNSGLLTYYAAAGEFTDGLVIDVTVNAQDNSGNQIEVTWSFTVITAFVDSCTMISEPGIYKLAHDIPDSSASTCINITADNVIFDGQGYTIDGIDDSTTTGIYVSESNVTIKNTKLTDWIAGIAIAKSRNNTVIGNNLSSNYYGIYLSLVASTMISNNDASNNDCGIRIEYLSNGNRINNNSLYSNDCGIGILGLSHNNTISNNTLRSNTVGIGLDHSLNNTIAGNTAEKNGRGIFLNNSAYILINNNNASSNYYGVYLALAENNTIFDNILNHNTDFGLVLDISSNNTIFDNAAGHNNISGIGLMESSGNSIHNNSLSDNVGYGIGLAYSDYNKLEKNDINSNYNGIYLYYSNINILAENNASSNAYGIYINGSTYNFVYNNYLSNSVNAIDPGTGNYWNVTLTLGANIIGGPYLGGNYWAKPDGTGFSETCTDGDSDGICDSYYNLASGNIDYLPLAKVVGQDFTPPTYSNLTPPNNSYTTDTGQDISIVIIDEGSDVNAGSLSMTVAGDYYDTNSSKLEYDTNSGLLTYNASDGEFNGGQVVYVVVNAEDNAGNHIEVAWSFTVTSAGYTIPLNSGWNLISIPLEQANWSITSVLAPIDGNYSVVSTYINGGWKKSTAARNPLTDLSLEYGYWIYMTAPDMLELAGTVPPTTTINVSTGWNLAGYPSLTTQNITTVLAPVKYSVVWAYINGAWKKSTAARNPLTEMAPGYGYWIYANEAGSYEVG